jgi:hypothetical protein
MKFFLSFLLLLIGVTSFSQETVCRAYKARLGMWNTYNKTWDWDPEKPLDVTIHISPTFVWLNNAAHTSLKIISTYGKEDNDVCESTYWNCVDQNGVKCALFMGRYKQTNEVVISVVYDAYCYRYSIAHE